MELINDKNASFVNPITSNTFDLCEGHNLYLLFSQEVFGWFGVCKNQSVQRRQMEELSLFLGPGTGGRRF